MDSLEQFTNCLDGLLRDPCGNIMKLNSADYEHQIYCGPCAEDHFPAKRSSKFVFRHGKLFEVSFDPNSDADYAF